MKNKIYNIPDNKTGISDILSNSICSFEQYGHKLKKVFYIQVKDKNGINKDKSLRVVEGSIVHKKLLYSGMSISNSWITEE